MGNRTYERVEIEGLNADISDGKGFFPGVIYDISRFGLRMTDLPKRINEKKQRMTAVISGHGRNFKMIVRPRWVERVGLRKMVGFEIINTPYDWTDFVMRHEPQSEGDAWEVINL